MHRHGAGCIPGLVPEPFSRTAVRWAAFAPESVRDLSRSFIQYPVYATVPLRQLRLSRTVVRDPVYAPESVRDFSRLFIPDSDY